MDNRTHDTLRGVYIIHTINKDMKSTFLTEEQVSKLEDINWDVIPHTPRYIKLYQDEMNNQAWVALCQDLGVDISVDHVRMLVIAKQVPNY